MPDRASPLLFLLVPLVESRWRSSGEAAIMGESLAGQALARALAEHAPPGLVWQHHPMPDEFHDTIYRASAPRALRALLASTPPPAR